MARWSPAIALFALLSATASAPAVAADSLWDVLRDGTPARKRDAITTPVKPRRPAKKTGVEGAFNEVGSFFRHLGKQLNSDIKVEGQHSMGLHMESVSGSRSSYEDSTYYGREGFAGTYNNTDLTIHGKVAGILNFETRYTNSLYGNANDNRVSLNYATKSFKLDAGDIQGTITGNSLVEFSRSLKGIELSADVAKSLRLTTLYTQTKAETHTVTLNGANRSGPYYVYAGQIVDGSEHVRVNDRDVNKGEDYTLDPYTGELNFLNGRIILETDTIAVTFETYGYSDSNGMITGWRADFSGLPKTRIGLTYLAQTSQANSSTPTARTEQFYGYNNPDSPYTLEYPVAVTLIKDSSGNVTGATPLYPMTVTVGSVTQIYGVDYSVDPAMPNRVYFRLAIPATQIIKISYVPEITNTTAGDRSVYGLDASLNVGKNGLIVAEYAKSSLDLSGQQQNGSAWKMRGNLAFLNDKLRWNWNVRDIAPGFTTVESPGFNRNERGYTTGIDFSPSSALRLSATYEHSRRPSYTYSSTSTSSTLAEATGNDSYKQANLNLTWRIDKSGSLNLTSNDTRTLSSSGSTTSYLTNNLGFTYGLKALTFDVGLATAKSLTDYGTTSSTASNYNNNSLTSRLGITWRAGEMLTLHSLVSKSRIRTTSGTSSNAQDMSLSAEVAPARNFRLTLGYELQDSGSYTGTLNSTTSSVTTLSRLFRSDLYGGTSSYTSSYSSSLYGGGYSTGLGSTGNYSSSLTSGSYTSLTGSSFGGTSRALTLTMSYQPMNAVSVEANFGNSSSAGDYLYNSRRNDIGLGVNYSPSERLSVNAAFSNQKVTYIGTAGGSTSTMFYANVRSRFIGKLVTSLSYQSMVTSSSSSSSSSSSTSSSSDTGTTTYTSTGSNMNSYGVRFEYPLWLGNSLYLEYNTASSTGYLASDQRTLQFGVDFALSNNMHFVLGWRNQQYISQDTTSSSSSSNYTVRSLDADLNLHF